MRHCFHSWRTTIMGLGAIFAALGDISYQIGTQDWHFDRLGADITGIFTGLGLIFARDSTVSESAHEAERLEQVK